MPLPPHLPLEIDCQSVKSLLDAGEDFLLLDCREPNEHQIVSLAAARLLPMGEIPQRLEELAAARDQRIVVHCHHGGRSLRVAAWLRQQGFPGAQSMAGGIDAWAAEIDPRLPRY
jgi:rhodanese-related sulfurtransferase